MGKVPCWTEQWERVLRWHERIKDQKQPRLDYEDDLWAFFQNCWHMKDWIKNDHALGLTQGKKTGFEDEVNRSVPLVICGDLANRTKHALPNNRRKTTKGAHVLGLAYHAHVHEHVGKRKKRTIRVRQRWDYRIAYDNGKETKALVLAKEAITAWRKVFKGLGLKVP